jgi:hypothetical protein
VQGEDGAKLEAMIAIGAAPRALRDVYRRLSAASRAQPRTPGFWTNLRMNILDRLEPRNSNESADDRANKSAKRSR